MGKNIIIKNDMEKKSYKNKNVKINDDISNFEFTECTIEFAGPTISIIKCTFNKCVFINKKGYSGMYITESVIKNCDINTSIFYDCKIRDCKIIGGRVSDVLLTLSHIMNTEIENVVLNGVVILHSSIKYNIIRKGDFNDIVIKSTDVHDNTKAECSYWKSCENMFIGQCPSCGSFIGWKKAIYEKDGEKIEGKLKVGYHSCIVKLLIPEDAERSSAYGRKCRASKAVVLGAYELESDKEITRDAKIISMYDSSFTYKVGDTIECKKDFDREWQNECSSGIHFFLSRFDAEVYGNGEKTYDDTLINRVSSLNNR